MIRRSDITTADSLGTLNPGVYVKVLDDTGALATLYDDSGNLMSNPLVSDAVTARFTYNIADGDAGTFTEEFYESLSDAPRTIEAIDLSIAGASAVRFAATRTALAALSTALPAFLTEAGRVGTFVWSSANLSTQVTADTAQGVYVAPTSAPTGASGAWVRQFTGALLPGWFGAVADDTDAATGTNNAAMFTAIAAVAELLSLSGLPSGNPLAYRGGNEILIVGRFYVGTFAIEPLTTYKLRGIGGHGWGAPSRIRFAAGTTAIREQQFNTSGASTVGGVHYSGDHCVIEDIYFLGAFTTTEAEAHGIHVKRPVHINRCTFDGFEGDGYYANSTAGAGAPTEGNTNVSRVTDCTFTNCRNGISTEGDDANACYFEGCSFISNRRWGVKEDSFLGNHYSGCHFDANGRTTFNTGAANHPASYVSQGGNWYFAIHGQETGASTNAPTGTTADNTWWGYWQAGGVGVSTPAWVSGITLRSGGPILINGANNGSTVQATHVENNGVSQFDSLALVTGPVGTSASMVLVSGGVLARNRVHTMRATAGGIAFDGNVLVAGDFRASSTANILGPNIGTAAVDGETSLGTRGTSHIVRPRLYDAAGAVSAELGYLLFTAGAFYYNIQYGAGAHNLRIAGTDVLSVQADGIHVTGLGAFSGALSASNLSGTHSGTSSGTNTGDQTITLTGDITGTGTGSFATTLSSATAVAKIASQAIAPASVAIGGGTALTKAVVYTPSITPASVGAATVAEQTFTVTGLTTADKVVVNQPAIANATGIAGARVSAADTLALRFVNPTAGALTPTSGTYTVLAFRS